MFFIENQIVQKFFWPILDASDFCYKKLLGLKNIPPASLRSKVNGNLSIKSFIKQGKQSTDDLKNALSSINKNLTDFDNILDFGCGCGRTILYLDQIEIKKITATDIDQSAIKWLKKNIPSLNVSTNYTAPPLNCGDNNFDLIFVFSVFTHLSTDLENSWLTELKRVLDFNGILIITIQGEKAYQALSKKEQAVVKEKGRLELYDPYWLHFYGKWYKGTIHEKNNFIKKLEKYFTVVKYLPNSLCNNQDIIILQKTSNDF